MGLNFKGFKVETRRPVNPYCSTFVRMFNSLGFEEELLGF